MDGHLGFRVPGAQNYGYLYRGPHNTHCSILGFILGSLYLGKRTCCDYTYPKKTKGGLTFNYRTTCTSSLRLATQLLSYKACNTPLKTSCKAPIRARRKSRLHQTWVRRYTPKPLPALCLKPELISRTLNPKP